MPTIEIKNALPTYQAACADEATGSKPNDFLQRAEKRLEEWQGEDDNQPTVTQLASLATAQALTRLADVQEDALVVHERIANALERLVTELEDEDDGGEEEEELYAFTPDLAVPPHIRDAVNDILNDLKGKGHKITNVELVKVPLPKSLRNGTVD